MPQDIPCSLMTLRIIGTDCLLSRLFGTCVYSEDETCELHLGTCYKGDPWAALQKLWI